MRTGVPATLLVALLAVAPVMGQDLAMATYQDLQTAYQTQTGEIADLQARLVALESITEDPASCDGCGFPQVCDPCCRSCGFVGGAELTFLKPHSSQGIGGFYDANLSFDYETAPRFWVGASGRRGLGVRFRWWDFDHDASGESGIYDSMIETLRFDTTVMDLEVTLASMVGCNWDLLISGGVRHVDYSETRSYQLRDVFYDAHSIRFGGTGLTAAAELRRRIVGGLSLLAIVRGSAVYGDENVYYVEDMGQQNMQIYPLQDTVKYIWEVQLGVQWSRPLSCGGELFIRGAAEAQYWDSFSGYPQQGDVASIGFIGGTVSAGILR